MEGRTVHAGRLPYSDRFGIYRSARPTMALLKFLKFIRRMRPKRKTRVVVVREGDCREQHNENHQPAPKSKDVNHDPLTLMKKFGWDEMVSLTHNFSRPIGSGGFSTVYLAQFPDSTLAAVKVVNGSDLLNRVYEQELEILLRLRHRSIIKLLGHCECGGGMLVLEYAANGTLEEKLNCCGCRSRPTRTEDKEQGNSSYNSGLSWKSRTAIAFQLAQAIEYLHDKCEPQIVHGDIKASNILLDQHLHCKLCDFGSAKMGFSSAVLPPGSSKFIITGSPGYVDPHYLRTGIASKKNDVYSFGVILLQLVTGMEAFTPQLTLTSIVGDVVSRTVEMVDPRLHGDFDLEEAKFMASLSAMCLAPSPILRPSATHVLLAIKNTISHAQPHHYYTPQCYC